MNTVAIPKTPLEEKSSMQSTTRRNNWLATLVAAALLAVGLGSLDAKAEDKKLTFIIAAPTGSVGQAPYYIAEKMGYWKQEGVEVRNVNAAGSTLAVQLVLSKQAELTCCGVSSDYALAADGKNQNLRLVLFYQKNLFNIFVGEGSPIKTVADLKGKKIGIQSAGSSSALFAQAIVAAAGLDPKKDVTFLPVGIAGQAAIALQNKQVDAVSSYLGAIGIISQIAGTQFRALPSAVDKLNATSSWTTTDEVVKTQADALIGYMRGLYKAYIFTVTNPEAAVLNYWNLYPSHEPKNSKSRAENARAMAEATAPLWYSVLSPGNLKAFGSLPADEIQATADFMAKHGIIETAVKTAPLVDLSLVQRAIKGVDVDAIVAQAKSWKP